MHCEAFIAAMFLFDNRAVPEANRKRRKHINLVVFRSCSCCSCRIRADFFYSDVLVFVDTVAASEIRHIYHVSISRMVFTAWHGVTQTAKKTREYFEVCYAGLRLDNVHRCIVQNSNSNYIDLL